LPIEARLLLGLAIASAIVYWSTPLAIRVADRFQFYDRPVGYKGHSAPTPYLGGAVVVVGFSLAALALSGEPARTLPVLGGVAVLWAVGTLDDRRTVTPLARVVVELLIAGALWAFGLGWDLGLGGGVDLVVTALWVVAVVNAFNLFDNMDGAACSMAAVVAAGIGLLGLVQNSPWVAVSAIALCGACLGFLPHNLFASPARIFLGDGGSMPLGFAVAALTMAAVSGAAASWQSLAMGLLFVGIPAIDTALVVISRRRRGIPILTGGRDHLTHRTRLRVRTVRSVAFALGGAQAVISALAVIALQGGPGVIVLAVVLYLAAAGTAITVFDASYSPDGTDRAAGTGRLRYGRTRTLVLLAPLAAGLGASPFFGGYYAAGLWIPIGLGLLALATGALIARPPQLSAPARLAIPALGGLGLLAELSSSWADSPGDARLDGARLLVYFVFTLLLIAGVRSTRTAAWLLGAVSAVSVGVALVVVARMLGSSPTALFLGPRLNGPLGYINGQGAFLALAAWPCIALAEQRRSALLSGAGMATAVLLAGTAVLSQSRGAALGALVAGVVVLAFVPGRVRRTWTLLVFGLGLATALGALLAIYDGYGPSGLAPATIQHAARILLLSAVATGVVWGAASLVSSRLERDQPWTRRLATAGALALLLVAALALVVSARPVERTLRTQYDAFIRLAPETNVQAGDTSTRLLSGSGHRYDYWRIAWHTFAAHPGGVGAGNYARPYFEQRMTQEDVRQPHSVELQTVVELGIPGAALLLTLLAGVGWGLVRAARAAREDLTGRALTVGAAGIVTAWLVHTSVDWLHLIPGITGTALLAIVVLLRSMSQPAAARLDRRAGALRVSAAAATAVALAFTGVVLAREGLAARYLSRAQSALAADPARALTEADRALRIDGDRLAAYYVKAAALARFDRGAAAVATLQEAARRVPGSFVTWALLGDLAVRTGDRRGAQEDYARALALNPLDSTLQKLARDPTAPSIP
jgi:UDP-GlcNAc:undecaprenyl-phosphate GlcNAc-1-phosphate transferase